MFPLAKKNCNLHHNLCSPKASPSPAFSCWERAVCSEPGRHACVNEFSLRNGELAKLSYRSREGAFASAAAASSRDCVLGSLMSCWQGLWDATGGATGNALPTWQRERKSLAGSASGMCLYVWEVTFGVSQEPDFSVETLLEGWLLCDSIKENPCVHGFWLDSSVVNPDLSFSD